jgi:hypothetical protein
MGLFDFLKKRPADPPIPVQQDLAAAIEALTERRTAQTQAAFEKALSEAILLLGVRELPSGLGPGANVLEDDVEVAVLESATPSGSRVLFAFTSPEEVHARNREVGIMGRPSRDILQMVLDDGYDLLAIDPAGIVLELTRADVASLLDRR